MGTPEHTEASAMHVALYANEVRWVARKVSVIAFVLVN